MDSGNSARIILQTHGNKIKGVTHAERVEKRRGCRQSDPEKQDCANQQEGVKTALQINNGTFQSRHNCADSISHTQKLAFIFYRDKRI